MSTVQSILDDLQFRVDVDADLYHLINRAIRAIAKRLYWHGSDILRSEMSVPIYASVDYTADTLAFVDSGPDTITDSASGFVTEGFHSGMYIETDHASNTGPFKINTAAAGTLTLVSTDSVIAAGAGLDVTITSIADYASLPADFWGLISKPHVEGERVPLEPLPSDDAALIYAGSPGKPIYYKLKGTKIHVIPATSSDIIVKADYWARPTAVTALTDTMPFDELFDDVIAEAVAMLYEKGLSTQGENTALLDKLCREGVDLVVSRWGLTAPEETPEAIVWD